ncbi:AAEL013253-PB [Aedes aegypti]|uniref:ubiquitinyl hydrolase 1 n=1 Tax=Aedes aegypti TaxID=7159 RepID=J9HTQ6_AEDAE|nr:AAEL013253-PB [Aedes aegypti]
MAAAKKMTPAVFAVSTESFRAKLKSLSSLYEDSNGNGTIEVEVGMMLQIVENVSAKYAIVRIKDYYSPEDKRYENVCFQCPAANFQIVPGDVWPFVIAIMDPQERAQFVKQPMALTWVKRLMQQKNESIQRVKVSGRVFLRPADTYDCIVRYTGPVEEIGPGYYLGLELLNGDSPQQEDIPYVYTYTKTEPKSTLILAANWIEFEDTKHSRKTLFDGFICGAKNFNTQIRKNAKRLTESKANSDSRDDRYTRSFTPDPVGNNRNSTDLSSIADRDSMESSLQQKRMAASVSSPNLSKQDSSSSTGSSSRIINHHPHDGMSEDSYRSGRSSQNSSNSSTLKHSKARKKPSNKAGTILNYGDRDIIVIDKADINEATSDAGNVIIVDPPATLAEAESNEVDLKELLGPNWPSAAGETASLLNNTDKKTQTPSGYGRNGLTASGGGYSSSSSNSTSSNHLMTTRYERNKSPNPISHLTSSKSSDGSSRKREPKYMVDVATMAKIMEPPIQWIIMVFTDYIYQRLSRFFAYVFSRSIAPPRANDVLDYSSSEEPNDASLPPAYDNSNNVPHTITSSPSEGSTTAEIVIQPSPLRELPDNPLLEVGSMVEVDVEKAELYGVIRWIGPLHSFGTDSSNTRVMVGIELEDEPIEPSIHGTDGTYNGVKLFKCPANRAIFVYPAQCNQDRRFQDVVATSPSAPRIVASTSKSSDANNMFGKVDCPIVEGAVAPLKILQQKELESICGQFRGIQGHHNSCYLDATLFSMFTFTSVFDSLLFRPREPEDNPQYEEVQRVLREEIVNPLRKNHFVRADRVMKLRHLLDRLSSVTGLTSEEKDPEEFLNSLLAQILRADPFLKLSSGLDTFYYQLFVEKDDQLKLPSVQQLFEQSFLTSNIKLKEVPSCLIIQMPRFGKNFKMYPRILPSQVLDVTDIIEDSPRQCTVCGKLAEHECRECLGGITLVGVSLESTAFCKACFDTAHSHVKRQNHTPSPLTVPKDFKMMAEHCAVPRLFMELFAVVCIETSHYVAFVKAGAGQDAPWVFFDSMADRRGEQNGYNIPEMIPVPDLPQWLSDEGARQLNEKAINDKMLPEHAKRLLCDAYMCMYQSTDVMMYR